MDHMDTASPLKRRLVEALYEEAMFLADEARAYFDEHGQDDRNKMEPLLRGGFSCESLKVTARLMHVIAWLLVQRAVDAGEISTFDARQPARRLGHASASEPDIVGQLPEDAQNLIAQSNQLYERVRRLDAGMSLSESPAQSLMRRLETSL